MWTCITLYCIYLPCCCSFRDARCVLIMLCLPPVKVYDSSNAVSWRLLVTGWLSNPPVSLKCLNPQQQQQHISYTSVTFVRCWATKSYLNCISAPHHRFYTFLDLCWSYECCSFVLSRCSDGDLRERCLTQWFKISQGSAALRCGEGNAHSMWSTSFPSLSKHYSLQERRVSLHKELCIDSQWRSVLLTFGQL